MRSCACRFLLAGIVWAGVVGPVAAFQSTAAPTLSFNNFILDPQDNPIVTGGIPPAPPSFNPNLMWVGKYNSEFQLQVSTIITHPNIQLFVESEYGHAVTRDSAGNIYVAGIVSEPLGSSTVSQVIFVAKYDANLNRLGGTYLSNSSYDNTALTNDVRSVGIGCDKQDRLFVAGSWNLFSAGVWRLDTQLNVSTSTTIPGIDALVHRVAFDSQGNVLVAGEQTMNRTVGPQVAYIAKMDANLNLLSSFNLGGISYSEILAIHLDNTDQIYVAGYANGLPITAGGQHAMWIAHLNPSLVMVSSVTFGSGGSGSLKDILPTADGSVYAVGAGPFVTGPFSSPWAFRFDSSLRLLSSVTPAGMLTLDGLAKDSTGRLVIIGWDGHESVLGSFNVPSAPTGVSAATVGVSSITWTWTVGTTQDNYSVLSSTGGSISGPLPQNQGSFTESSLMPNTLYNRQIQALGLMGQALSASATAYTRAAVPSGTSVAITGGQALLSWTPNGNPAGTLFHVEMSSPATPFHEIYVGADTSQSSLLQPGALYSFRVRAANGAGLLTAYDLAVSTMIAASAPVAPTQMQGVSLSSGTILWTWTDNATDELGYRVRASSTSFLLSGDLPANTAAWTQTELVPNTTAQAYVEAFNNTGVSAASTATAVCTLAAAPSGSAAIVTTGAATVSWSANQNPARTIYHVEISTDGAHYQALYDGTGLTAVSPPLSVNVLYSFRVRAENATGLLTVYDTVVSTGIFLATPVPPSGLSGFALSPSSILWTWTDHPSTESGYRIRRASDGLLLQDNLPPGTTAWLQTGLAPNTSAQVSVDAFNVIGESPASTATLVYTQAAPPTGTQFGVLGSSTILLSWFPNGNPIGTTLYDVEEAALPQSFVKLFSVQSVNALVDGLIPGTTYQFRVRAENAMGVPSAYDVVVSTELAAPTAGNPFPPSLPPISDVRPTLIRPSHPLTSADQLEADFPSGYSLAAYYWTFSLGATSASVSGHTWTAAPPSAPLRTNTNQLALSATAIPPGTYQLTLQVQDTNGQFSLPLQESIDLFSSSLSQISVYPNPWRADRDSGTPWITFSGLPSGATVKIYTLSAYWIRTLNSGGADIRWSLDNDAGSRVASGLYFYVIDDGQGNHARGKLSILR